MTLLKAVEYSEACDEAKKVYDEIKNARNIEDVNNFWKFLANDPKELRRTWDSLRDIMGEGAIDPLTKEMVYIAVSVANGCSYCIHSHSAAAQAKGMSDEMQKELMAVIAMASKTNAMATALQVPVDDAFK